MIKFAMSLTKEEKERIKEEESYRNKVREKINKVPWWKPKGCLTKIVLIILGLSIFGSIMSGIMKTSTGDSNTTVNSSRELKGEVNYINRQIAITNSESVDWTMCKLKLNGKYNYPNKTSDWVPSARLDKIKANDTTVINASEFTLNDGTVFNGYSMKPIELSISCENGFNYYKW